MNDNSPPTLWSNALTHILHSSVAASAAEITTLPIATIKTNYQNTNGKSISLLTRQIWAHHGLLGFYNSSWIAMLSQVLSTTAKYTWYSTLKQYTPNKFVAGGIAGALTSVITHPLDVVKVHQQMHTPFLPELRKFGFSLFYRGYTKTLSKYTISSIFYYPLYDTFRSNFSPIPAAVLSSTFSTFIIQPIDYMKIRHINNQPWFHGFSPKPYFKGTTLNLARSVPQFTVTMMIIEWMQGLPTDSEIFNDY